MAAGAGRETRLRPGVSAPSQKDAAPPGRPQRRTEGARAPDAAPPAPEGAGGGAFSTSGLARGPADAGTSARRGPQQTSGLQDPKAASPRRSNPPSPWEAAAAAAGIRRSWPREPGKLAALKFHSRRLAGGRADKEEREPGSGPRRSVHATRAPGGWGRAVRGARSEGVARWRAGSQDPQAPLGRDCDANPTASSHAGDRNPAPGTADTLAGLHPAPTRTRPTEGSLRSWGLGRACAGAAACSGVLLLSNKQSGRACRGDSETRTQNVSVGFSKPN